MRGGRRVRALTAAAVALLVMAPGFVAVAPPAGAGEGQRYVDPIFSVAEEPTTRQYGYNEAPPSGQGPVGPELYLDLYTPVGDTETRRPVVIVAHGGSFCSGGRGSPHIARQARWLAERGWVTASIDYRYSEGECRDVDSVIASVRDAAAAVRWFRANAEELSVDPSRIAMLGYSAGAFTSVGRAYGVGAFEDYSGNPGYPSTIAAAVSEAGAWFGNPTSVEPPVQIVHGDQDVTVPFQQGLDTCDAIRAADGRCELVVHEGVAHGLPLHTTVVTDAASFFRRCMAAHPGFPDVALGGSTDLEPAVGWMAEFGITQGYADGLFKPMNGLNRHQLATFLWRLAGEPPPDTLTSFPDVPSEAPYAEAVAWFAETGITQGYPDGSFGPGRAVTRHQVATFLWRAVGEPEPPALGSFPDVGSHLPYAEAVAWLASTGITQGYADGLFKPANQVNRSQAAQFLWRLGRTDAPWSGPMDRPEASCTNVDLTR